MSTGEELLRRMLKTAEQAMEAEGIPRPTRLRVLNAITYGDTEPRIAPKGDVSARDELIKFVEEEALGPIPLLRETMDALIDAYAHRLAEKQREYADEQRDLSDHDHASWYDGMDAGADLIDPEVE